LDVLKIGWNGGIADVPAVVDFSSNTGCNFPFSGLFPTNKWCWKRLEWGRYRCPRRGRFFMEARFWILAGMGLFPANILTNL